MTATTTWIIEWMQCYPQAEGEVDVVFNVGWRCNGTDGTYNATIYSTCAVTYKAGSPYTPYNDLTQNQVLQWIWDAGVDKDATQTAIDQQIQNQINPPVTQPALPWLAPSA